jgi:transcriptional regulator with XRE-family HTH domain
MEDKETTVWTKAKKYSDMGDDPNVTPKDIIDEYKNDVKTEFNMAMKVISAKKVRRVAVANRLKALRKEAQKTQKEVADATGINDMTLAGYEGNRAEPHIEALVRLADFYQVSLDYLMCRTDTKNEFNTLEYRARDEERNEVNKRLQELEQELANIRNAIK